MSENLLSDKQLWIIGAGPGGRRYVTRQEAAALKHAQLFIGTRAAISLAGEYTNSPEARTVITRNGAEIRRTIIEAREQYIAVLTEGDPCTSGELDEIWASVRDLQPVLFPGITLASYMASKAGMSCAGAPVVDLRFGQTNLAQLFRQQKKLLIRTTKDIRPVMRGLAAAGFGKAVACVCENPGLPTEQLFTGNVRELAEREISSDAVILLVRAKGNAGPAFGIRDEAFGSPGHVLPSEVRAVLMSKLSISPEDIVYVMGASAGDIVVEAASAACCGLVYAIDESGEAAARTLENCRRFGSRNVRVIEGKVPPALGHLEPPDAVILRGLKEETGTVIQIVLSRNPSARIAVVTCSPETAVEAMRQLKEKGVESEMIEMSGSRSTKKGERHALSGNWSSYLVTSLHT